MLKNYIKIMLRNFIKHRFYSVLNIIGLAIGLACCILIGLFLDYELGYDRHHKNGRWQEKWTAWKPKGGRPVESYILLKTGYEARHLQNKISSLIPLFGCVDYCFGIGRSYIALFQHLF